MKTASTPRARGRGCLAWLGRAVVLVGGLLLLGALYESMAEASDERVYPPPGELVDVGGYRLHINCTGTGGPTVIIDTGLGDWSTMWSWVQSEVAKTTQVCTYDRIGNGWSEPGPLPRNAVQYAKELHTLLQKANLPGPYVLVGPLGLVPHLPPEVEKAYLSRMVRPSNLQAYLGDESQGMPESGRQAEAVKTFGDLSLIVLTARQNNIPGWQEWQKELLQLSSDSQQLFADSGHNIEIELPEDAIAAIVKMVETVRSRQE